MIDTDGKRRPYIFAGNNTLKNTMGLHLLSENIDKWLEMGIIPCVMAVIGV